MIGFGFALERVMLRKLIGRPVIAVVMATIGLAAILRGLGPFGIFQGTRTLPLPIREEPFLLGPLFIPPIQLLGAAVSLAFLAASAVLPEVAQGHRDARGGRQPAGRDGHGHQRPALLRAGVGDDGRRVRAGRRALGQHARRRREPRPGGLQGVPGGDPGRARLDPGRHHRGLIVGIVENVAAGYVDPYVGGGTKDFAPYVLMIVALMIRPYGIFGKRIIERV